MSDQRNDEMKVVETHEGAEGVVAMNQFAKIYNVIIAPTRTMEAIKTKPTILVAMIVTAVIPLLYYVLFWGNYEVQLIQMLESQFASMGMELTRDMLEMQLSIQRIATPVGSVVGVLFGALIGTTILFVVAKIIKSKASFKTVFSVTIHAMIISSLVWIMHMIMSLTVGESNILEPVTSINSLLPESMYGTFLYGFLSPIDIFSIWYYVVLYIGLTVACGFSKRAAGITVTISLLVGMLIAGSAFLMQSLAGM